MKTQNKLKSAHKLLNTSSETFMLIALIGLFALPFVVGKNLEPVVKEAEDQARNYRPSVQTVEPPVANNSNIVIATTNPNNVVRPTNYGMFGPQVAPTGSLENEDLAAGDSMKSMLDIANVQESNTSSTVSNNPQVLGVSTETVLSFEITENQNGLRYFDDYMVSVREESYQLKLMSNIRVNNVEVFSLKNTSGSKQTYRFNIEGLANSSGLTLYVDGNEFIKGVSELPNYITLNSGDEVSFSLSTGGPEKSIMISVSVY